MSLKQAFEFIRNEDVENLRNISNLSSFINDDDGDGYTLLFYACSIGRIDVMKFLLTVKGIDVNKKYRVSSSSSIKKFKSSSYAFLSLKKTQSLKI